MKYTGIAEAGDALAGLLKRHMVPEVVKSPEQIGLCSPADKGDYSLGIWLYDIRECEELRTHSMIAVDSSRQRYPSCFVNLFFMITAYSGGDIRYRAREEQYILGKVIQTLKDYAVIKESSEADGNAAERPSWEISMQNLSMEDKMRIFNIPGQGYKTSLFYELGPVEIESEKARKVTRVVDVRFDMEEKTGFFGNPPWR